MADNFCTPIFLPMSPGKLTVLSEARVPVQEAEQTGDLSQPFSTLDSTYVEQRVSIEIFRLRVPKTRGESKGG